MTIPMDAVAINTGDFIRGEENVVDTATRVGAEAARHLRQGGAVVVSVRGVRGVSSSFFNVVLSMVAEALRNDFSEGRFSVETDGIIQRRVYERSLDAVSRRNAG